MEGEGQRRRGQSLVTPLEENLLTLRDFARYLGVSEKTVRRWVAARRIPCLRLGRTIRFDRGDVFRWVSARKEG